MASSEFYIGQLGGSQRVASLIDLSCAPRISMSLAGKAKTSKKGDLFAPLDVEDWDHKLLEQLCVLCGKFGGARDAFLRRAISKAVGQRQADLGSTAQRDVLEVLPEDIVQAAVILQDGRSTKSDHAELEDQQTSAGANGASSAESKGVQQTYSTAVARNQSEMQSDGRSPAVATSQQPGETVDRDLVVDAKIADCTSRYMKAVVGMSRKKCRGAITTKASKKSANARPPDPRANVTFSVYDRLRIGDLVYEAHVNQQKIQKLGDAFKETARKARAVLDEGKKTTHVYDQQCEEATIDIKPEKLPQVSVPTEAVTHPAMVQDEYRMSDVVAAGAADDERPEKQADVLPSTVVGFYATDMRDTIPSSDDLSNDAIADDELEKQADVPELTAVPESNIAPLPTIVSPPTVAPPPTIAMSNALPDSGTFQEVNRSRKGTAWLSGTQPGALREKVINGKLMFILDLGRYQDKMKVRQPSQSRFYQLISCSELLQDQNLYAKFKITGFMLNNLIGSIWQGSVQEERALTSMRDEAKIAGQQINPPYHWTKCNFEVDRCNMAQTYQFLPSIVTKVIAEHSRLKLLDIGQQREVGQPKTDVKINLKNFNAASEIEQMARNHGTSGTVLHKTNKTFAENFEGYRDPMQGLAWGLGHLLEWEDSDVKSWPVGLERFPRHGLTWYG